MDVQIPHFSLPLRLVSDSFAVNEQDTDAEVRDCVEAIIRTPIGTRIELPDFGVPDTTFEMGGPDPTVLEAPVEQWEPRAEATASTDNESLGDLISQITVGVKGGTP